LNVFRPFFFRYQVERRYSGDTQQGHDLEPKVRQS